MELNEQATVYSMKLKLEFRILNQLTEIAQEKLRSSQAYFSAQSESLQSPLATRESTSGGPEKDDMPRSLVSPGTPRRRSQTAQSLAEARIDSDGSGTFPRRFSTTGGSGRMANIDESALDVDEEQWPERPAPLRTLTAPLSAMRTNSAVGSMPRRRVSIV